MIKKRKFHIPLYLLCHTSCRWSRKISLIIAIDLIREIGKMLFDIGKRNFADGVKKFDYHDFEKLRCFLKLLRTRGALNPCKCHSQEPTPQPFNTNQMHERHKNSKNSLNTQNLIVWHHIPFLFIYTTSRLQKCHTMYTKSDSQ